jgi:hypothetical protein
MDQVAAYTIRRAISHLGLLVIAAVVMAVAACASSASAAPVAQKTFASPEDAVKALVDAARNSDIKALLALLGPAGKDLLFSGDPIADRELLLGFVQEYDTAHRLTTEGDRKVILHAGSDDWVMPIPIVKQGDVWRFDTEAGRQEVLNRRIGRNELAAIQVCRAMVDAQLEYATRDRMGDGVLQYAQKFVSTPGKHDGLFWATKEGEEPSPLGPLAARAAEQGYTRKGARGKPTPYHGYFYRILKSQGKDAPGGALDYVADGRMIGGFAILAYPAKYGNSGVMTFMVNQDGVVYQKNLGPKTEEIALAMRQYNPDSTWKKAD